MAGGSRLVGVMMILMAAPASLRAAGPGEVAAPGRIPAPSGAAEARPEAATALEVPLDPQHYRVGRGDVLTARLWGEQNFELSLHVDPDGQLFVPHMGQVAAQRRTLAELSAELQRLLRSHYPRLQVAVTLATPRTFLVRITGAVARPGRSLPANAWTRASALIAAAGGVAPGGSSRRVELHRADGTVERVDLLLDPLFGDRSGDPLLGDGDWVHVPLAEREVTIRGAVNRPGTYELVEGTLAELVSLAGGLTPEATDRFALRVVSSVGGVRSLHRVPFRRERIGELKLELGHHDEVTVPDVNEGAMVVIQGALGRGQVESPKSDPRIADTQGALRELTVSLPYVDGETARGAILRAGGLASWADLGHAWIERSPVWASADPGARGRTVRERGQSTRIPLDLRALFVRNDLAADVELWPGDTLYVPSARVDVVVSGHVLRPGIYGYSMQLGALDYVALAGGETRDGDLRRARVVSGDGKSRRVASGLRLLPGDAIVVPGRRLTSAEWASLAIGITSTVLSATVLSATLTSRGQ